MSDTNDMRRDFEAWMLYTEKIIVGSSDPYPAGLERERWRVWQAATKSATALERERCAVVAENQTKRQRTIYGMTSSTPTKSCNIASAIRQGGAG